MSTSATNKSRRTGRTLAVYVALSVLCVVVDRVYALFSHGVASLYMSLTFLFPLLGGGVWLIIRLLTPKIRENRLYRPGFNLYNAGLATLAAAFLLTGILEIAGAASVYVRYFYIAGGIFGGTGFLLLCAAMAADRRPPR